MRRRWGAAGVCLAPCRQFGGAEPMLAIETPGASRSPSMEAAHCAGLRGVVAAIVQEGFGILCFLKLQVLRTMRLPAGAGGGSRPFLSCTLQEKLLQGGPERSWHPSVPRLAVSKWERGGKGRGGVGGRKGFGCILLGSGVGAGPAAVGSGDGGLVGDGSGLAPAVSSPARTAANWACPTAQCPRWGC